MENVKRVTLAGGWTEITFNGQARYFFVKNYSDSDIYVSFEENDTEATSVKIASKMAEEVAPTFKYTGRTELNASKIYIKGTGEVEVQALDL